LRTIRKPPPVAPDVETRRRLSTTDLTNLLGDLALEIARSGRNTARCTRCDLLLEALLVEMDRRFCARYEETR